MPRIPGRSHFLLEARALSLASEVLGIPLGMGQPPDIEDSTGL